MAGGFSHILIKKTATSRHLTWTNKLDDIIVFDEDFPKNCKFSFVDFAPTIKLLKNNDGDAENAGKYFTKCVTYSELVEYANKWLLNKGYWDVISCECIPAIIQLYINGQGDIESKEILITYSHPKDEDMLSENQIRMNNAQGSRNKEPVNFRVQLLRLWIKRFVNKGERLRQTIPQLAYIDFAPNHIKEGEVEDLDSVITRVNESINNREIGGKILSIQTLACSATKNWEIDVETAQSHSWIGKFVFVLRLFYTTGHVYEGVVGVADFVPECLSSGNLFKKPKFETQSVVLKKASKWLSDSPGINICSAQSLDVKPKSMSTIDTKQMSIRRETGNFIRILRIAYTKPKDMPLSPSLPLLLENQVLVLYKSYADLKTSLDRFMNREEWSGVQQHKWILLSCETVNIFSANDTKTSLEENSEQSLQAISSSKMSINRNLYYALKLYYNVNIYGTNGQDAKN